MKKLVKVLIVSVILILSSAFFSACALFNPSDGWGSKEEECMHPVAQYLYAFDENYHWHPLACEHNEGYVGSDKVPHSVGNDGKCYCGYRIECTLVFKGDGIGEIPSQTVRAGEKFTEPATPERDGYVFDCWKFQQKWTANWEEWDFEHTAYANNLELTAFWTRLCTVTYDTAGGEMPQGTDSVQVYRYGEDIADPVTPEREKFEFKGWSSNPDNYVEYDFKSHKTARCDVTLYAFWVQLYYVDYHYMDGNGTVDRLAVKKNYYIVLQGFGMTTVQRDHYDHLGWTTVEGGSVVGTPDGDYDIEVTEDVALYAVWIHTNNITYDGTGGWVYSSNGFANMGQVYSYTVRDGSTPFNLDVRRDGYTFVKWTDDTSTGEPFDFDKELESDVTVYAVWTYYTVNMYIDDEYEGFGEIDYPSEYKKVTVGRDVNVKLDSYYIRGYEFDGWYNDDGEVVSDKTMFSFRMTAENVSLAAKWRVKDEMSNFEFTSDRYTLTINSVKDKTVTEIVVPDYATEIADSAFYGCNSVESITLPVIHDKNDDGKSYSLEMAFLDVPFKSFTTTMRGENYPQTLTTIIYTGDKLPKYAFYYLNSLTSITLSDGITEIPERAFYACENLTSVTLPQCLITIGKLAFGFCGLTSINLPSTLEILTEEAFFGCRGITEVVIPESLKEMGSYCFYADSLESFTFAKSAYWIITGSDNDYSFRVLVDTNYADSYRYRKFCDWHVSKY